MNNNEHDNKLEQRIRFVAKRYREGSLDPDKAWQKFASEHVISRKVSFRRYWIEACRGDEWKGLFPSDEERGTPFLSENEPNGSYGAGNKFPDR